MPSEFTNITNKFKVYQKEIQTDPRFGKVIPNSKCPEQYNEIDDYERAADNQEAEDAEAVYNRVYVSEGDGTVPRCPGRLHNCLPIRSGKRSIVTKNLIFGQVILIVSYTPVCP